MQLETRKFILHNFHQSATLYGKKKNLGWTHILFLELKLINTSKKMLTKSLDDAIILMWSVNSSY